MILKSLTKQVDELEGLVVQSLREKTLLRKKIYELQVEVEIHKRRIDELIFQNKKYEEEIRELKLTQALSGNKEFKRLMKSKFNAVIREIDSCLAALKNEET